MIFTETKLKGLYIIEIEPVSDERGFFARALCKNEFEKHGLCADFVQHNISNNISKGTVRGLHYQLHPHEEIKVVRCLRGVIFDVAVDMRQDSATYKQWVSIELSEENRKALYVPKGFAHGYQTLLDNSTVFYLASEFYNKEFERGAYWKDTDLDIKWPIIDNVIISEKDNNLQGE